MYYAAFCEHVVGGHVDQVHGAREFLEFVEKRHLRMAGKGLPQLAQLFQPRIAELEGLLDLQAIGFLCA
ncbi:hypothetical protein D3C87_1939400 [compost metagenome]